MLHKAQEEQDRLMAEDEQFKINQTLRETQDREYEEALALDRAIEEQRMQQEAEEAIKRDAKNEKRRKTMEHKEQLLKKFIDAPDPQAPTTIVVRLPGGIRIERRFEMTAPVSILYEWVLCCGFLHANAEGVSDKIKVGNFSLATSFRQQNSITCKRPWNHAGSCPTLSSCSRSWETIVTWNRL